MKKEMLINVLQPEECRIAIVENGTLEELYVERTSHESYVGNIYKGRIVNIEPSIQAAFVDFGVGRNGFLHVSDVEPAYYRHLEGRRDRSERGGRGRGRGRDRRFEEDYEPRRGPVEMAEDYAEIRDEIDTFDEIEPVSEASQPTGEEAPPVDLRPEPPAEESAESAPPVVAHPDTLGLEEESGRQRRRTRGTSRRKKTPAEAEPTSSPESEGEPTSPPGEEDSPGSGEEDPPRPRLMDSAERRTDRDTGSDPAENEEDDDLLFFPRQETGPQAEIKEEEPDAEVLESEGPEEEAAPPPPPQAMQGPPPGRVRPSGPRGSIEDQLAADLAAAEIDEFNEFEDSLEALPEPIETEEFTEEPPFGRGERRGGGGGGGRRDDRRDDRRGRGGRRNRRGPGGGGGGGGRLGAGRPKPLIQDIFKRGQEVLVQVIKEGLGSKGPTLSTYISIAGRYLVLMPGLNRVGVSRKIQDDDQRRKLRELFMDLKPPKGLGFIIRTAVVDKNKKELKNDLSYLARLWQVVVRRIRKLKAPVEIYQESDMITRTIRDIFSRDIDTIWVDEPEAFQRAQEFLQIVMPSYADRIKLYEGTEPLFHKYGIEEEIGKITQKKLPLPNGGSIVIEQTEALVAIDVNSGNFRADNNAEETAYQVNLQAAREIARQLRLRDLGGVIVNDFIDMRDEKHRRAVEKAMREAVKRDRARTKVLKISAFGIIEMTRQRIRPSLKRSVYMDCPYCHGMAQVKTPESLSIEVMRLLQLASCRETIYRVEVHVTDFVADYLQNKKRSEIAKLEEAGGMAVQIFGKPGTPPESLHFVCYDKNDNEVPFHPLPSEPVRPRR
jgi:ribonuclease E